MGRTPEAAKLMRNNASRRWQASATQAIMTPPNAIQPT